MRAALQPEGLHVGTVVDQRGHDVVSATVSERSVVMFSGEDTVYFGLVVTEQYLLKVPVLHRVLFETFIVVLCKHCSVTTSKEISFVCK